MTLANEILRKEIQTWRKRKLSVDLLANRLSQNYALLENLRGGVFSYPSSVLLIQWNQIKSEIDRLERAVDSDTAIVCEVIDEAKVRRRNRVLAFTSALLGICLVPLIEFGQERLNKYEEHAVVRYKTFREVVSQSSHSGSESKKLRTKYEQLVLKHLVHD